MAGGLRSKGTNIFVYVLLGLLVLGLAGFGIGNFGGSVNAIGSVGDTKIDVQDYSRALQQELRSYQQRTGQAVTMNDARALGLDTAVLGRLVAQAAIAEEAKRMRVSVGDEAVRTEIVGMQPFQGQGGTFDRDTYAYVLSQSGLKPAEFETMVRADTTRSLLENAVSGGLPAPDVYTDTLLNYVAETRSFEWTQMTGRDAPVPEPTDAELRSYYDANSDAFSLPEARRLTYAWITPAMLADTVEVSDEDIAKLYAARADQYQIPEKRLVERLIFATEQEAQDARARLDDGSIDFAGLVTERGLTLEDVDMGEVAAKNVSEAAASALFAQKEPGIVGPVETSLGPALFRVNGILPAQETPLDQVRDELRKTIGTERAVTRITEITTQVDDLLASGATLEEIAKETDLKLGTIDLRPGSTEPIAGYEAFRTVAAQAKPDDFPQIEPLADGGVFALRLDEVIPPQLQPFDQVRQDVFAGWTAEALRERLMARAKVLTPDLQQGATFADLFLDSTQEEGLKRDDTVKDAPPALVQKAFEMKVGDIATVDGANGSIYILRLTAITPPANDDKEVTALSVLLSQQIRQGQAQDLLRLYGAALQGRAGVQLNQTAINSVNAQFP